MDLKDKALNSKTFCIYPWMHQYVGPQGEVKPCCIFDPNGKGVGNIKDAPLSKVWNNDATKQVRLDMLNGVEVPGCSVCSKRVGVTRVHRDEANDMWISRSTEALNSTLEDGTVPEHKLKYIDARFNNLCNFRCRTCSPHFSTSWHEDYEKLRNVNAEKQYVKPLQIPGNTDTQLLDEIWTHLPEVDRIYFAGGEPLMQIEHYKILEELINIKHTGSHFKPLWLLYSTNFSKLSLGKHSVLEYWKKFNRVTINASLDGSYKKAEYWRKGTDWAEIVQNRILLKKECPRVMFNINFTLSWVNAFDLLDLHKEWVELNYININALNASLLDQPSIYSLKSIPTWKKKKIEDAFRKHIDWMTSKKASDKIKNQFIDAINFMYSNDTGDNFEGVSRFMTATTELDNLRNENFWDVYPEHTDMKEFIYGPNTV